MSVIPSSTGFGHGYTMIDMGLGVWLYYELS